MSKNQKGSPALVAVALFSFLAGGVAWFLFAMIFAGYEHFAVPVAAALAALGGFLLILNAVLHPGSIRIPEVKPPEINIKIPEIRGVYGVNPKEND